MVCPAITLDYTHQTMATRGEGPLTNSFEKGKESNNKCHERFTLILILPGDTEVQPLPKATQGLPLLVKGDGCRHAEIATHST